MLPRITTRLKDKTGGDLKNKKWHYITTHVSWFDAISVEWKWNDMRQSKPYQLWIQQPIQLLCDSDGPMKVCVKVLFFQIIHVLCMAYCYRWQQHWETEQLCTKKYTCLKKRCIEKGNKEKHNKKAWQTST